MSGVLMGYVYYYQFSIRQRNVLLTMADHANEDGDNVFPGVDTLVWKMDGDRRNIQKTIRELEQMGVLVPLWGKEGGRGQTTHYRIVLNAAPLKETPPPSPGMRAIWESLKGGTDTAVSDDKPLKGGTDTAVSAHDARNDDKGRYSTHTKGGIPRTKGGIPRTKGGTDTARTVIEPSYNRQEETARARRATDASTSLSKNENAEAEAEPPLLARRPPYDDRQFRRWALSQTGGWANLAPKRLDLMMDEYCRVKGIAG